MPKVRPGTIVRHAAGEYWVYLDQPGYRTGRFGERLAEDTEAWRLLVFVRGEWEFGWMNDRVPEGDEYEVIHGG